MTITRPNQLKKELDIIRKFRCMTFDYRDMCTDYYMYNIRAIEE